MSEVGMWIGAGSRNPNVQKLTLLEVLREDIKEIHRQYYSPDRLIAKH
jgi:hypothetical protein